MKKKKRDRRQIFVLTPEEKRTLCFVLAALIIGIGAKRYREKRAVPLRQTAVVETAKTVALPAQRRADAKRRKQTR